MSMTHLYIHVLIFAYTPTTLEIPNVIQTDAVEASIEDNREINNSLSGLTYFLSYW